MAQPGTAKVAPAAADHMIMASPGRTVVVVSNHGSLLERLVSRAGFDVVGQAETAVNAEHLIGHFRPDVVVLENELVGMTGIEALGHLRSSSPASQFVLIVADDWVPSNRGEVGAFAVLTRSRLPELTSELEAVDRWLAGNAAGPAATGDRRTGRDRRIKQEWSKVGWERRVERRRGAEP